MARLISVITSAMLAGLNAQEAARQVSTCSDQVAQRTQAQLKDFTASVRSVKFTAHVPWNSARHTSLLDLALCLLGNQDDKEQETHRACVQSEPLHVCLL